jgi:hypothetical protein
MKRLFVSLVWLFLAGSASAQIAGGAITGTIHDQQGGVLPGATLVVTSGDFRSTGVTDSTGKFRFLNLSPGRYRVTATLGGFSEFVQDDIVVLVGATSDLAVTMKLSGLQESITVGAGGQSPIVDPRRTGTATNFTLDALEKLPTSRDIFALLRTVPGVLTDRVNVGGNETGNAFNPLSKGTRPFDTTWTLDGIVVTEMVSTGGSPLYYNYDNFEEVQVSTAGQDITQPTGGLGINLVVRHGTNAFHGLGRAYFTNDALEATNVPRELENVGISGATADHTDRLSDYGFDLGGPLVKDRMWFYGSFSQQNIDLIRAGLVDRTVIRNPNLKVNWQASRSDRVSFLYFDGDRIREGRAPVVTNIFFPAATATHDQHNAYADNPFHGLWKIEDNRTFGSALFASAKLAYFNTGFQLDPVGGMDMTSGRSQLLGRSFGSVNRQLNVRPQWIAAVDATAFRATGGMSHDIKMGTAWRRVQATSENRWPDNGFLALENSAADRRVRIFRVGGGTNQVESFNVYVGDTMQRSRLTVDVGVRFDHQTGEALASSTEGNPVFPALVPGVTFPGFKLPTAWNTVSPRAGLTYALTETRRAILRASWSRFVGQMPVSVPALMNPTAQVGFRDFRWNDINGDHLATTDEVVLTSPVGAGGGGFNAANPTAVTTPNQVSSDFSAPVTTSAVGGVDYELRPNVAVQLNYSYTRSTNTIGSALTRLNVTQADYVAAGRLTGTLHDGLTYDVPLFAITPAALARSNNGVLIDNWRGYSSDYHGIELTGVKRLSDRWMARLSLAWNNAREHYSAEGLYDMFGNPTRQDTEPLVDGGQYAPSPNNDIFLNAKWQVTAEGLYQLPKGIELAGVVFGRQGYPFVPFRSVVLGNADQIRVLLSPRVDTYRLPNVWNTDLRVARPFTINRATVSVAADLFNVFNSNAELIRVRNADAANYRAITSWMSPRILRFGVRVGF